MSVQSPHRHIAQHHEQQQKLHTKVHHHDISRTKITKGQHESLEKFIMVKNCLDLFSYQQPLITHGYLKVNKSKQNQRVSSVVALATFRLFNSHMCLMATMMDNTDVKHFHHCRKFYWTAQVQVSQYATIPIPVQLTLHFSIT